MMPAGRPKASAAATAHATFSFDGAGDRDELTRPRRDSDATAKSFLEIFQCTSR